MLLNLAFDNITFNGGTDTAIVRAEDTEGRLILPVFITRRFVEDTWNLPFSIPAVRRRITEHAIELTALATKAHEAGRRDLVLDDLSRISLANVPVII
jgi:hypothetical protein